MSAITKTTAMAHQTTVVDASWESEYYGLFMEQGTGKTWCTIATAVRLFRAGKLDTVIVLAPNGVHDNWALNEIPTHSALSDDEQAVAVWHSSDGLRKQNRMTEIIETAGPKLLWILANIEALRTQRFIDLLSRITMRTVMTVVDESTVIKNPKAIVTKAAIKLGDASTYRRILSGTPMSQGPLDLWSQCRFLSKTALPYTSWTAFKCEFATEEVINLGPHRPSFVKITGYRNQSLLSNLIRKFSHRVLKKDCLDLPDKVYSTVYVEMTPEQKTIYKDLVSKAVAELNPGVIAVTTALALIMRLQQVVLGYAPNETGELVPIPCERIGALVSATEGMTGKAIIFCRFKEDVRRILAAIATNSEQAVEYHGDIDTESRSHAIKSFQEDPEVRWFVATNAAARGLTLTAAENVIYYSQGYSLEARLQSEDRAHRIGQTKTVIYTDLVARGTVDEQIIRALKSKKELADVVIDRKGLMEMIGLVE